MIKYYSIFILIVFSSCGENQKTETNFETKEITKLKNDETIEFLRKGLECIETGDSTLYDEVSKYFKLSKRPEDLYYYASVMAFNYNNGKAYHDLYFLNSNTCRFLPKNKLNNTLTNNTLYFLAKSVELGQKFRRDKTLNITKDELKESSYYLDKIKEPTRKVNR